MHRFSFVRACRKGSIAAGAVLAIAMTVAPATVRGESEPPAVPLRRSSLAEVPEPLRPWVPWVLAGHEQTRCPVLAQRPGAFVCAWPSRLGLDVDARGGRFSLEWRVFAETLVPLPGDERHWPRDVRVGERAVAVVLRAGRPQLRLDAGAHRVSGSFVWAALPAVLALPPEVGLVSLSRDGGRVDAPLREPDGRLWLGERSEATGDASATVRRDEDRLSIDVRRRLRDAVPAELETRVELDVSGRAREQRLAAILVAGFEPLSIESVLPARLDATGDLILQLRPGRWSLTVHARSQAAPATIALAPPGPDDAARDESELWAFEAVPALRVVDVEGGTPVDPEQTTLPAPWRSLPSVALQPGQSLRLVEKRRGDADPPPDRLAIERTIWLDFDGGGFTARDRVRAEMQRGWRLEASPELALERVSVDGRDLPVTLLPGSEVRGVEVRSGVAAIDADARIDGAGGRMPAAGWRHDVVSLASELRLPPGWRLLHASGPDEAEPTWTGRFSNLDLFLIPIFAMAAARLFGLPFGALALGALVLSWHEIDAPRWTWALLLALESLLRLVTALRWSRALRVARLAALIALCVMATTFAIGHVRAALHPSLETPPPSVTPVARSEPAKMAAIEEQQIAADAITEGRSVHPKGAMESPASRSARLERLPESVASSPGESYDARRAAPSDPYAIDPGTPITTGPGVPDWEWNRVALVWRGPVTADQELRLWLLSPRAGLIVAALRVALLAALVLAWLRAVNGRHGRATPTPPDASATAAAALVCALVLSGSPRSAAAGDFPSQALLDELRSRLTAPPECLPDCAALGLLRIEARDARVRLRFAFDTDAELVLPVIASPAALEIEGAWLDGEGGLALRRLGTVLQAVVPKGRHELVFEGRALADAIELAPGLSPTVIESSLEGWLLEGATPDSPSGSALRLVRASRATPVLLPGADTPRSTLPPFFHVARTISLGTTWEVETRVERVSPPGVAASFDVPLLPGESPTAESLRVEEGAARIVLGPQESLVRWRSVLPSSERITLLAAAGRSFSESWQLDATALWHVESSGLAPRHAEARDDSARPRSWSPWPGETVVLAVSRPTGIEGSTLTIDRASLSASPGARATDDLLELVVRSSRGGTHVVTLPADAELQSVTIDGREQPLRLEAGRLALPISPGTQPVAIRWREPHGLGRNWHTPSVDLGAAGVNASLRVEMPRDRWPLVVRGPLLGPAVLFWSVLAVLAPIAVALARSRLAPPGAVSWFLLGLGLTQVPVVAAATVPAWLLALGARRRHGAALGDAAFRSLQLALLGLSAIALLVLFGAVRQGLLGLPEMQIDGNGSSSTELRWYADRFASALPEASVVSLPLWVYRTAMLVWSFWLAASLLRWGRFAVDALVEGGFWRAFPPLRRQREMRPKQPE